LFTPRLEALTMGHWILLLGAIVLEVCGTTCMKLAEGFSKVLPSVLIFVFYGGSFAIMTVVVKKIDISVAYAIWSGLGTTLIAAIGMLLFKEPATAVRMAFIALIIAGCVGLNLTSARP
jgi:small multidrug resistance pump